MLSRKGTVHWLLNVQQSSLYESLQMGNVQSHQTLIAGNCFGICSVSNLLTELHICWSESFQIVTNLLVGISYSFMHCKEKTLTLFDMGGGGGGKMFLTTVPKRLGGGS